MSITKRQFLATSSAFVAVGSTIGSSRAAEFNYKLGCPLPATHPISTSCVAAADAIRKESGGRLDIQVFPDAQLGNNSDMLSQTRSGALELFALSAGVLAPLVPAVSMVNLGFAFKDHAQIWAAMDGPVHEYLKAETLKRGILLLDHPMDSGFRQFTTGVRPIEKVADLKGLKIRAPLAPIFTTLIAALGASPTSIQFNELYTALQTKLVDGQENPLALIHSNKMYEVQKYCSITNHMWDGFWFSANQRAWEKLPADLRAMAAKSFGAAGLAQRDEIAKLDGSLQKELERLGMIFNTPDTGPFRAQLRSAGFYSSWKTKLGDEAWGILEQSVGKLG